MPCPHSTKQQTDCLILVPQPVCALQNEREETTEIGARDLARLRRVLYPQQSSVRPRTMGRKLHAVNRRRMNHGQRATPAPVVALLLGVWPLDARLTTFVLALAMLTVVIVMLRLRRRMRADHAARLQAERQAALAHNLQELVAAVSRVKTPANVIEVCVPECLDALSAAAGAFVLVGEGGRSGEVVRVVGHDEPLTRLQFPLSTYPGSRRCRGPFGNRGVQGALVAAGRRRARTGP